MNLHLLEKFKAAIERKEDGRVPILVKEVLIRR
jgi:hypothetical protein